MLSFKKLIIGVTILIQSVLLNYFSASIFQVCISVQPIALLMFFIGIYPIHVRRGQLVDTIFCQILPVAIKII